MSDRFSVLFVCRGNTKRSRGAEVIAAAKAERMGMDLDVSSAGLVAPTEGYELFNSQRLQKVLKRRGYEAGYHRRQQVTREMMEGKDLVLAMNNSHIKGIYDIAPDLMDKDTPIVDTLPAFVGYPHRRIVDPEERIDEVWKSEKWKWMRWMPYEIDLEMLFHKVIETVGPDRIIFATDSSYFPRGFCDLYLREQLKACRSIGLDEKSIKKIFYGNAAKLLKIKK